MPSHRLCSMRGCLGNILRAFLYLLLSQIYGSIHFGVYISFKHHLLKTDGALL